jgi:hypothetical protein
MGAPQQALMAAGSAVVYSPLVLTANLWDAWGLKRRVSGYAGTVLRVTKDRGTLLQLHLNGTNGSTTFTDSSLFAQANAASTGSPSISTAQSVFGGASLRLNGSSSLNYAQVNRWRFQTSEDFTIRCRVRFDGVAAFQVIFSTDDWTVANNNLTLRITSAGLLQLFTGSAATPLNMTGATALSANTWYAVAVERFAGTTTLYLNGNVEATSSTSYKISNPGTSSTRWRIGAGRVSSTITQHMTGYVDEFEVLGYAAYGGIAYTPEGSASATPATANIGLSGDALDTAALATFAGSDDVYVDQWTGQANSRTLTHMHGARPRVSAAGTYLGWLEFRGGMLGAAVNSGTPAAVSAYLRLLAYNPPLVSVGTLFTHSENGADGLSDSCRVVQADSGVTLRVVLNDDQSGGQNRTENFTSANLTTAMAVIAALMDRAAATADKIKAFKAGAELTASSASSDVTTATFAAKLWYIGGSSDFTAGASSDVAHGKFDATDFAIYEALHSGAEATDNSGRLAA